jgi:hypothetical protein
MSTHHLISTNNITIGSGISSGAVTTLNTAASRSTTQGDFFFPSGRPITEKDMSQIIDMIAKLSVAGFDEEAQMLKRLMLDNEHINKELRNRRDAETSLNQEINKLRATRSTPPPFGPSNPIWMVEPTYMPLYTDTYADVTVKCTPGVGSITFNPNAPTTKDPASGGGV